MTNIEEFEKRPLGDYELRGGSISGAKWLEKYSALEIFRAAKVFWKSALRNPPDFEKRMVCWEDGCGPRVALGHWGTSLHRHLLALVLPHVCKMMALTTGNQGILPPKLGWKSELSACNTYITNPISWPVLVEYTTEISDVLLDLYPGNGYFNIKFGAQMSEFSSEELSVMPTILDKAYNARKWARRTRLSMQDAELLDRLIDVAGDLTVSHLGERVRIGELG